MLSNFHVNMHNTQRSQLTTMNTVTSRSCDDAPFSYGVSVPITPHHHHSPHHRITHHSLPTLPYPTLPQGDEGQDRAITSQWPRIHAAVSNCTQFSSCCGTYRLGQLYQRTPPTFVSGSVFLEPANCADVGCRRWFGHEQAAPPTDPTRQRGGWE